MFEGVSTGDLTLKVSLFDRIHHEEYEADSINIKLQSVEDYYVSLNTDTARVPNYPEYRAVHATPQRFATVNPLYGKQLGEVAQGKDIILFIHGYNVSLADSAPWFTEIYKRLYWSG